MSDSRETRYGGGFIGFPGSILEAKMAGEIPECVGYLIGAMSRIDEVTLMDDTNPTVSHLEIAAGIVAAYVSKNSLPMTELPRLIESVHASLGKVAGGQQTEPAPAPKEPAVSIRKSITNDFIVCLEDGKKFKSLKRHLSSAYGLTPDAYRAKWGLRPDYPMVAPSYASARSALAVKMGLGQKSKGTEATETDKKPRARKAASERPDPVVSGDREPRAPAPEDGAPSN